VRLEPFTQVRHLPLALVAGHVEPGGGRVPLPQVLQHHRLRLHEPGTALGGQRRQFHRDRRHAVAVTVQEVARVHPHPAHPHRDFQVHDLRVAVGGHRTRGEARELERFDLVEVAAAPAGDQPDAPERLVRCTHDLAERRGRRRVVQVLEHDHLRPGRRGDFVHLPAQPDVRVAALRRGAGAERRGGREPDHRRQRRVARLDAGVHVPGVPRPHLEQLQHVAHGRGVVLAERVQHFGRDGGSGHNGPRRSCQFAVVSRQFSG
jgi:hypothetical protein